MTTQNYSYYKVSLKLLHEMLATCPEASIYEQHVLTKTKKLIKQANALSNKVTKNLEKYQGVELSEQKELNELKAIIRAYEALVGEKNDLDVSVEELLEVAKTIEEKFNSLVEQGEQTKATVFMKDEAGHPVISSHMLLGNFKEILKVLTNGGDKTIFKSKVQVGESLALDIKVVEEFLKASGDIIKNEDGDRVLCERPIRFTDAMGKTITAIAQSEQLPPGTVFTGTFRIRKSSALDNADVLERILDMGKNLGLGAWRGSGNKGAFLYKIEQLPDFKETYADGWN